MNTLSKKEAINAGYTQATTAYFDDERDMMMAALKQYEGCTVCLVRMGGGLEIWRKRNEMVLRKMGI